MKLEELYKRSITRRIDPVATVDALDEDYIEREIEEYFFTDTLLEHLTTFFNRLFDPPGIRTGVWINGYYGSGKSHFLKYIYYCLSDAYGEKALDHFKDSVVSYTGEPLDQPATVKDVTKIRNGKKRFEIEPLMFNMQTVADTDKGGKSVNRVFYNQFNDFRGYNRTNIDIARFEKWLDGLDQFDAFREAFAAEFNDRWEQLSNDVVDFKLDKVVDIAADVADIDPESTRRTLESDDAAVDVDTFVSELEDYIDSKPDDYRLVYLVDEVSQFMEGQSSKLLQLQTIVEEIGERLEDKVWIVCTAQQKLDELVNTVRSDDSSEQSYGKIMARFETYLPLESQDADQIARQRVLDKSPEGAEHLRDYFEDQKTAIQNQFERADSQLYAGYDDEEQFVENYPFVPYQFQLLKEVIKAFKRAGFFVEGVSDTERSLIGNTHKVAMNCREEEVGYFVPFDRFFKAELSQNLTHRARDMIHRAMGLDEVKNDSFAQRVVHSLFLISNLRGDQKNHFPATADKIAFSLIDEVDPNFRKLKERTKDVLDMLVDESVVSESNGVYRFLQEEEVRVKKEIDNTPPQRHDRLQALADRIISDTLDWDRRVRFEGCDIKLQRRVDDIKVDSSGDIVVSIQVIGTGQPDNPFNRDDSTLTIDLTDEIEPQQREQLDEAVSIRTFIDNHSSNATPDRREALDTFEKKEEDLLERLQSWFEDAIFESDITSGQTELDVSRSGSDPESFFERILERHLEDVYSKRNWVDIYTNEKSKLRRFARDLVGDLGTKTKAEKEVESRLNLEQNPTFADLMRNFEQPPYGWTREELIDILLRLEQRNDWKFRYKSSELDRESLVGKATKKREATSITFEKLEDLDPQLINDAKYAINHDIFNENLIDEGVQKRSELKSQIDGAIDRKLGEIDVSWREDRPFAVHIDKLREDLEQLKNINNEVKFFETVVQRADELGEVRDLVSGIFKYWDNHADTHQQMERIVEKYIGDDILEEPIPSRLERIQEFVEEQDKPHEAFKSVNGYFDEVRSAIEDKRKALRQRAKESYEEMFNTLKKEADSLGVEQLPWDRRSELQGIERLSDLHRLQSKLDRVNDRRAELLKKLNQSVPSEDGEATHDSQSETTKKFETVELAEHLDDRTLESTEDVEALVERLRDRLQRQIDEGKTIIIK